MNLHCNEKYMIFTFSNSKYINKISDRTRPLHNFCEPITDTGITCALLIQLGHHRGEGVCYMRGSSPTRPSVTLTMGSHRTDAAVTTKDELLSNSTRSPAQLPCCTKVLTPVLLTDRFDL